MFRPSKKISHFGLIGRMKRQPIVQRSNMAAYFAWDDLSMGRKKRHVARKQKIRARIENRRWRMEDGQPRNTRITRIVAPGTPDSRPQTPHTWRLKRINGARKLGMECARGGMADAPDLGSGSVRIRGSSPLARTINSNETGEIGIDRTNSAHILTGTERPKVRFPKVIRYRRAKATIYGKTKKYPFYRLAYYVAGKRLTPSFKSYGDAKAEADRRVREISNGSDAAALTGQQARDALAARQRLENFRQSTGRRFSLLSAASELVEALEKLKGRSLGEAIDGFLTTVATVKRKNISEAVEEFLASRKHKSEAKDGKRAQLSDSYEKHVASWLRGFAGTFTGSMVCDLTKEHINLYFQPLIDVGTKNRNDRRAVIRMFLVWASRQDYLPFNHRLLEANGMTRETVDRGDVDFFRPAELQELLNNAADDLRPVLAMAGLAGLRIEEIMRLEWADVWRVDGHIEISARQAKTRQRRLVIICPALAAWLKPCRDLTGKVYPAGLHVFGRRFTKLRKTLKIQMRKNGLRHAFCTYHFALHANENLTAQQAGNSPAMIHAHYKGLATKADAEKWFAVHPKK
jgi:integrase